MPRSYVAGSNGATQEQTPLPTVCAKMRSKANLILAQTVAIAQLTSLVKAIVREKKSDHPNYQIRLVPVRQIQDPSFWNSRVLPAGLRGTPSLFNLKFFIRTRETTGKV